MNQSLFSKVAITIKSKFQVILLTLILIFVAIPYLPKFGKAFTEWKERQVRERLLAEKTKTENENKRLAEKQTKLLNSYGITNLNNYDIVYKYLEDKNDVKLLGGRFGTCENPKPPSTLTKNISSYFKIDFNQFKPSSEQTPEERGYYQFKDNCAYLEKNLGAFNLFSKDLTNISRLISENYTSKDPDIQNFTQSLNEKITRYYELDQKGYIKISPLVVSKGDKVKLEYGYLEPTNEHLNSANTVVTVETPSKKVYKASPKLINGSVVYPDDFTGALTNESGEYSVWVKRTVVTTYGTESILYSASDVFRVVNE